MLQQEEVGVGGTTVVADQLDLEAAEQLIQLSGGDADGDGGSETRSVDSVKCGVADDADRAGVKVKEEKDREAAVESRLRKRRFVAGKDGDGGGEPDRKSAAGSVVSKQCSSRAAGTAESEKGKEEEEPAVESRRQRTSAAARVVPARKCAAGVVDDGEERRRPRFRRLADIYRETRQVVTRDLLLPGGNDGPHHREADDERTRKRAKKIADDEEVGVPAVVSKESKKRTMVA